MSRRTGDIHEHLERMGRQLAEIEAQHQATLARLPGRESLARATVRYLERSGALSRSQPGNTVDWVSKLQVELEQYDASIQTSCTSSVENVNPASSGVPSLDSANLVAQALEQSSDCTDNHVIAGSASTLPPHESSPAAGRSPATSQTHQVPARLTWRSKHQSNRAAYLKPSWPYSDSDSDSESAQNPISGGSPSSTASSSRPCADSSFDAAPQRRTPQSKAHIQRQLSHTPTPTQSPSRSLTHSTSSPHPRRSPAPHTTPTNSSIHHHQHASSSPRTSSTRTEPLKHHSQVTPQHSKQQILDMEAQYLAAPDLPPPPTDPPHQTSPDHPPSAPPNNTTEACIKDTSQQHPTTPTTRLSPIISLPPSSPPSAMPTTCAAPPPSNSQTSLHHTPTHSIPSPATQPVTSPGTITSSARWQLPLHRYTTPDRSPDQAAQAPASPAESDGTACSSKQESPPVNGTDCPTGLPPVASPRSSPAASINTDPDLSDADEEGSDLEDHLEQLQQQVQVLEHQQRLEQEQEQHHHQQQQLLLLLTPQAGKQPEAGIVTTSGGPPEAQQPQQAGMLAVTVRQPAAARRLEEHAGAAQQWHAAAPAGGAGVPGRAVAPVMDVAPAASHALTGCGDADEFGSYEYDFDDATSKPAAAWYAANTAPGAAAPVSPTVVQHAARVALPTTPLPPAAPTRSDTSPVSHLAPTMPTPQPTNRAPPPPTASPAHAHSTTPLSLTPLSASKDDSGSSPPEPPCTASAALSPTSPMPHATSPLQRRQAPCHSPTTSSANPPSSPTTDPAPCLMLSSDIPDTPPSSRPSAHPPSTAPSASPSRAETSPSRQPPSPEPLDAATPTQSQSLTTPLDSTKLTTDPTSSPASPTLALPPSKRRLSFSPTDQTPATSFSNYPSTSFTTTTTGFTHPDASTRTPPLTPPHPHSTTPVASPPPPASPVNHPPHHPSLHLPPSPAHPTSPPSEPSPSTPQTHSPSTHPPRNFSPLGFQYGRTHITTHVYDAPPNHSPLDDDEDALVNVASRSELDPPSRPSSAHAHPPTLPTSRPPSAHTTSSTNSSLSGLEAEDQQYEAHAARHWGSRPWHLLLNMTPPGGSSPPRNAPALSGLDSQLAGLLHQPPYHPPPSSSASGFSSTPANTTSAAVLRPPPHPLNRHSEPGHHTLSPTHPSHAHHSSRLSEPGHHSPTAAPHPHHMPRLSEPAPTSATTHTSHTFSAFPQPSPSASTDAPHDLSTDSLQQSATTLGSLHTASASSSVAALAGFPRTSATSSIATSYATDSTTMYASNTTTSHATNTTMYASSFAAAVSATLSTADAPAPPSPPVSPPKPAHHPQAGDGAALSDFLRPAATPVAPRRSLSTGAAATAAAIPPAPKLHLTTPTTAAQQAADHSTSINDPPAPGPSDIPTPAATSAPVPSASAALRRLKHIRMRQQAITLSTHPVPSPTHQPSAPPRKPINPHDPTQPWSSSSLELPSFDSLPAQSSDLPLTSHPPSSEPDTHLSHDALRHPPQRQPNTMAPSSFASHQSTTQRTSGSSTRYLGHTAAWEDVPVGAGISRRTSTEKGTEPALDGIDSSKARLDALQRLRHGVQRRHEHLRSSMTADGSDEHQSDITAQRPTSPKPFLRRKSQKVSGARMDWSNVKPRVDTRLDGNFILQKPLGNRWATTATQEDTQQRSKSAPQRRRREQQRRRTAGGGGGGGSNSGSPAAGVNGVVSPTAEAAAAAFFGWSAQPHRQPARSTFSAVEYTAGSSDGIAARQERSSGAGVSGSGGGGYASRGRQQEGRGAHSLRAWGSAGSRQEVVEEEMWVPRGADRGQQSEDVEAARPDSPLDDILDHVNNLLRHFDAMFGQAPQKLRSGAS